MGSASEYLDAHFPFLMTEPISVASALVHTVFKLAPVHRIHDPFGHLDFHHGFIKSASPFMELPSLLEM